MLRATVRWVVVMLRVSERPGKSSGYVRGLRAMFLRQNIIWQDSAVCCGQITFFCGTYLVPVSADEMGRLLLYINRCLTSRGKRDTPKYERERELLRDVFVPPLLSSGTVFFFTMPRPVMLLSGLSRFFLRSLLFSARRAGKSAGACGNPQR